MALPSSGNPLSLSQIQTEFGGNNPISLSEYYSAASGIPSSGTISVSDFYGASAFTSWSRTATETRSGIITTLSPAANASGGVRSGGGTFSVSINVSNQIQASVNPTTVVDVGYVTWPDVGGAGIPQGTWTLFYEWVSQSGNNFVDVATTIFAYSDAARTMGSQLVLSRVQSIGISNVTNSDSVSITVPAGKPYLELTSVARGATNTGSSVTFLSATIS